MTEAMHISRQSRLNERSPGRSTVRFGVQTPLQDTSVADLRTVWRRIEAAGFDWISVWDHLGSPRDTTDNLEAVAMHAALACTTSTVRCGCLVYAAGYRSPVVLADAVATIDHLNGGRAVIGLGAGYVAREHQSIGEGPMSPGARSARLAETTHAIRTLLDGAEVTVAGRHVRLDRARCAPVPQQAHLPIYIAGGGERSTIPLAAVVADGWNVAMPTSDDARRKITLLREHEAMARRRPGSVEASVNIGWCPDATQLPARFGERWRMLAPAVLTGTPARMVDQVGEYVDAGVDRIIVSVRSPLTGALADELDGFAADVARAFR